MDLTPLSSRAGETHNLSNTPHTHTHTHTHTMGLEEVPGDRKRFIPNGATESEVTQSCLTLCDPMDCSLPGSSVHGIFQARILEWVAISFSRDLSDQGIEPRSPALLADALPSEPLGKSIGRSV